MEQRNQSVSETGQRPVARFPWMPFKESRVKPKDNLFFLKMMANREEGKGRLEFYRILTKTFPFYLPKR